MTALPENDTTMRAEHHSYTNSGASQVPSSSAASSPATSSQPAQPSQTVPSSLPPGQPPIRMTDSQSGPNGPSLKFAALSVESYHLDSPPFTGAAVGSSAPSAWDKDKLDQAGQELLAQQGLSPPNGVQSQSAHGRASSSSSSLTSASDAANSSQRAAQSRRTSSRDDGPSGLSPHDQDVPAWQLDSRRATGSGNSHSAYNPRQPTSSIASSLSQLDKSLTSPRAPVKSTSPNGRGERPLHTQLTDDIDGLEHQHEPDQEVDGDGHGFVLRQTPSSARPWGEQGVARGVVPVQSEQMADYVFPHHRLPLKMRDESKIPLVIVACGSFSPPTYLHLRIFEMAKDQVIESGKYELLAGYYSPVSDHYRKAGLAQAKHRVRMCELAVEKTSTWLMVDAWESLQNEYQRTAVVLDHFNEEINGPIVTPASEGSPPQPERGVLLSNGRRRRVKIMLLAGGDLIQSMGEPGVWADADLHHILGRYGCMIVERTGADVWSFLLSHDLLWRYRRNLRVVKQTIYNDISSSKVRLFVRRGQSIKYLLPNSVIKYIETHKLYRLPAEEEKALPAPEDENW